MRYFNSLLGFNLYLIINKTPQKFHDLMPSSPRKIPFPPLKNPLKNVFYKMRFHSRSNSITPPTEFDETHVLNPVYNPGFTRVSAGPDCTSLISDENLLCILSKVDEKQLGLCGLVCKRWEKLSGKLVKNLKLLDWEFLDSGRLIYRFPNLIDVDVVRACVRRSHSSGIVLSSRFVSVELNSGVLNDGFVRKLDLLDSRVVDQGIRVLVEGCLSLRKLVLVNVSEEGLSCVAEGCKTLQELELYCCCDFVLRGIAKCQNLQILKLVGCIDGFYDSVVSDIGLTILAQGCRRLVQLELVGCEGSFDGIKAVGQCCQMLEELTLCDHRMDGGWLAALSYCSNLKTLKLKSCKSIDSSPGPDEHLSYCRTLEELHLQHCQMRYKQGVRALFIACQTVRDLVIEDCWGLDNVTFAYASICRRVRLLSLEGCSLLTMEGFDPVVLSWKELNRLKVISCNNIKDGEITIELATLFSSLKELKWRPDSRSIMLSGLAGTGVGQRGGRSFGRK